MYKISHNKITLLLIIVFFLPLVSFGDSVNAGFVQGIWYSSDKIYVGKVIRVYAAIHNQSDTDIHGSIGLYDNGSQISSKDFSVIHGSLANMWFDWDPTYGEHKLSIRFDSVFGAEIGEQSAGIEIGDGELLSGLLFVDVDTDSDGIGNEEDEDDDNDGYSDSDEKDSGSDPLEISSVPVKEAESVGKGSFIGNNIISNIVPENLSPVVSAIQSAIKSTTKTIDETAAKTASALESVRDDIKLQSYSDEESVAGISRIQEITNKYLPIVETSALSAAVGILENKFIMYPLLLILGLLVIRFIYKLTFG